MAVLGSLVTTVCTRLLLEPGKVDCCKINGGSFCLPEQAHVSLADRVRLAAAARKLCSARSLEPRQMACCLVGCDSLPKCK